MNSDLTPYSIRVQFENLELLEKVHKQKEKYTYEVNPFNKMYKSVKGEYAFGDDHVLVDTDNDNVIIR